MRPHHRPALMYRRLHRNRQRQQERHELELLREVCRGAAWVGPGRYCGSNVEGFIPVYAFCRLQLVDLVIANTQRLRCYYRGNSWVATEYLIRDALHLDRFGTPYDELRTYP